MYIHIFFVHIQFFSWTYQLLPVHNTNTFCKYRQTSIVCFFFTSLVYILNTIGIERSIIPGETAFKPMGLPYGVSPNSFMYIIISLYITTFLCTSTFSLYITTRSCTYLLPCTQIKLVNNQVTLVLNVRFTDTCLYFLHKLL